MDIEPPVPHRQREQGRVVVEGRRTDDGTTCTLLTIHEPGGTWLIHSMNSGAVRLSKAAAVALAQEILERAR